MGSCWYAASEGRRDESEMGSSLAKGDSRSVEVRERPEAAEASRFWEMPLLMVEKE